MKISYSQYSTWKQCPYRYKLNYIDGHYTYSPNIHVIFGTALHETLQKYLSVLYSVTEKTANGLNLNEILKNSMLNEFIKYKNDGYENIATEAELNEYFLDGMNIINWFKKHRKEYFPKKDHVLIGCEVPLEYELKSGIMFVGYLDVVIKDIKNNKIKIIDFKKSYNGWKQKAIKDEIKRSQLQLYKIYFSKQFNIPIDNIDIEFLILKQKVFEHPMGFTIKRIQRVVPPSGTVSLNKANKNFQEFIDSVFINEKYNINGDYRKIPGDACKWCPFSDNETLCDKLGK